jgi:serine/threonine-protein kinase
MVLEPGGGDILGTRPSPDTSEVALVATEFFETSAAVSPNGKWLAYVSNQTGPLEIHVRPFPNTADGQWQVTTGGGTEPVWAYSGRELFYRNGDGDLVAVEVTTTPTFSVGTHRELFPAVGYTTGLGVFAGYDVSLDDQRFVMIRLEDAAEGELILVQNFFEELKAKVGSE